MDRVLSSAAGSGKEPFSVGASAVIFDDSWRVLLCLRRDVPVWNLPGGAAERGETPWEAVIREVYEEVGVEAEVVGLSGVYSKPEQADVVFCFVCRVVGGKLRESDEAAEIRYFAVEEMPETMSRNHAERVRDALEWSGKVSLKVQPGPSADDSIA